MANNKQRTITYLASFSNLTYVSFPPTEVSYSAPDCSYVVTHPARNISSARLFGRTNGRYDNKVGIRTWATYKVRRSVRISDNGNNDGLFCYTDHVWPTGKRRICSRSLISTMLTPLLNKVVQDVRNAQPVNIVVLNEVRLVSRRGLTDFGGIDSCYAYM